MKMLTLYCFTSYKICVFFPSVGGKRRMNERRKDKKRKKTYEDVFNFELGIPQVPTTGLIDARTSMETCTPSTAKTMQKRVCFSQIEGVQFSRTWSVPSHISLPPLHLRHIVPIGAQPREVRVPRSA